ncbi:NUDIX hydrolase [Halalkalibacter alkalisediminis]|uniref:NUDIX hydrolase n=1 Tax=Halalkalibacter alkalisediminis TaxID=935616 RepID=A0ABV6NKK6_9BACI|nr:NUDIX domain-containing protein [Halalkalibacter alkalisediminis]
MGYIEELRALVGHTPLILNSSGVIIYNRNKVLLSYRNDTRNWGLPGGYMERGETVEENLERELIEEMGITLKSPSLYRIFSGQDFYHEYPNGDKVYSVIMMYIASGYTGEIIVDNKEIKEAKYFDINQLPPQLTRTTKKILTEYRKEII